MRDHKSAVEEKEEEETDRRKHNKRWFQKIYALANDAISEAGVADRCTMPGQRHNLVMAIEPTLVSEVRKGGEALIKIADFLDELLDEAAIEYERSGDAVASVPIQDASTHAVT
jgi:hypothetical protein